MADIQARIESFILESLLLGDDARLPTRGESLMAAGVIDSTGILELIEFLEQEFGIEIDDGETVPENLDGIDRIAAFIAQKSVAA